MEASKQTILARTEIINQKLLDENSIISQCWSREALLDSFVSYFDECSAEYLKSNREVSNFIDTYRFTISELKKLRINVSDFEVLKLIGQGNFGCVHLVKERQTEIMYAMKTIRKSQTVNNVQTCFVAEREIMASSTSSWHTLLQYAFQDSTKLYMVMDYHPGGDLRGVLERQVDGLDEEQAVFYLRELLIAISNLHDLGFIHRDIKPDNVLVDIEGHIKLADFGSAARINSEGTVAHKDNIAAGTPDYIAPEVLLSCGKPDKVYGRSCDYWSLGIIAYEMIFGGTPFTGATIAETYSNIIAFEKTLIFPDDVEVDKDYSTFVKQLLSDEVIRPDYEKIICTPLFRDTCWDSVRDFDPPFVPILNDPEDTSLFTGVEIQPQPPNIENFLAKSHFSGRNLPFIGFTYVATKQNAGPSATTGTIRKDDSLLERKQRKIESLRNKLVQFDTMKEEHVALEQRYEESKLMLKSAKAIRQTVERDLASVMTEASSLRKTLEAERNERKDLELRAIDLIRSAKERWKAEEDVRNAELLVLVQTQTQQITDLTTSNNDLTQKLHKVTETAASCALELKRLRDVQEQYENKLKSSRDQSRKSFCGLQNQLKLVSDDAESRVESLKKELEDAWTSNQKLQDQSEEIRHQNKLLEAKLKASEEDFKAKLTQRDAQISELNQAQEVILFELTASNERENNLQDQLTVLQNENAKLNAKCNKAAEEKQLRERECEQLRTLYNTNTDKLNGNLEDAVAQQKAKDEIRVKKLQNTVSQLENKLITLLPQIQEFETSKTKIAELESLVARLEAGKNKDPAATAREELLKEQLERSQTKVQELHESAALSNRELNKIKSELWAKEKSLKDSSIDARILSRELQDAQKEIKALQEQVKVCEERAKMAEDLVNVDHERARAAEAKHLALVNENAGLKSRVARSEMQVQKLEAMEAEAGILKTLRQELEQKIENQQRQLTDYNKATATAKQLEISAKHEISRLRADLDAQHTAYAALQESSTILEQQVDGYDRLVITLKNKEESLEARVTGLENDLAATQEILQSTNQTLKIARNDRIGLDTTIRVLEVQMSELEGEKQSLKEDLARFERRYKELVDVSNDTEKEKNEALLKIQNQQSKIDTLKTEIVQLKEETSERLTHLLQVRDINQVMTEELLRQRNEIDQLNDAICETQYSRDASQQRSQEEIISLAIRLKQFEKVSDSLLDRLAVEERKKKTIAKIFHKKNPEPPRPSTYFDLKKQYTALQTDYNELKLKFQVLEGTLDTPMTMRVQKAMADASMQDARELQAKAAARLAKAAVDATRALEAGEEEKAFQDAKASKAVVDARQLRAVEVVQHAEALAEFQQVQEDARIKAERAARDAAAACEPRASREAEVEARDARAADQLRKFKAANEARRAAAQSSEATAAEEAASTGQSSTATVAAERWEPRPENLFRPRPPQASTSRQPTLQPSPAPTEAAPRRSGRHCFRFISCIAARKCRWCWQSVKMLRGACKCYHCGIIIHKTCQSSVSQTCGIPEDLWTNYNIVKRDVNPGTPVYDLENIVCWLYLHLPEGRQLRYLIFTDKTVKLYTDVPTVNTPPKEQYPLGLGSVHTNLVTDLSGRFRGPNIDKFVSVLLFENKESDTPCMTFMLEFLADWDRELFIDAILSQTNVDLIPPSDKNPYTLHTFNSVLQLSSMLELDNLILMGGAQGLHAVPFESDEFFTFNNLKHVQQISLLPTINSILVIAGTEGELLRINVTQFINFNTLISNPVLNTSSIKISNHSEAILSFQCTVVNDIAIVCAATAKQIIILHFDSDANDFKPVRVLDSAEPCSALLIDQNSLFICADKFFSLNLHTFKVHEMVDATDPGLAHVSTCQRAGTYPASVVCLSMNPPEYMLCYSEFAVFVDQNGRKSRQTQINWKHFPLHFAYSAPNLFVFQFSAIEVFQVCPEMNANNRGHWTCPPSIRIELIRPKYLTDNEHGIYFSCLKHCGVSSKSMYEQVCLVSGTVTAKQLV